MAFLHQQKKYHRNPLKHLGPTDRLKILTLKAPRKPASENVVCLCRLLHLLANFSNIFFAYMQTVWTQISLIWVHTVCNNDF